MARRLSPRAMMLAYRIWAVADPVDWSVSLPELAAMLGEDVDELRRVCKRKGWLSRLAADEPESMAEADI
ncbi:hypothetical protein [Citreimonas sp.]|uniref:hypothetical protein n=1 Tax=Citreimonas sp. TaxID=3036715 RepID=UPI00405903CC